MEQLKTLKDIFQNGFITNDEYIQRLRQIVDTITGTNIKSPQKSVQSPQKENIMKSPKKPILQSPNSSKRKAASITVDQINITNKKQKLSTSDPNISKIKSPKPIWRQISSKNSVEDEKCVCGLGWGEDRSFMLACDRCSKWFHGKCMGLKNVKDIPEKWYCEICQNFLGNNRIEDEDVDIGEEVVTQENNMNAGNITSLPKSPKEKKQKKNCHGINMHQQHIPF